MKHFKDHVDVTDEESFNKAIRSLFCLFKPEWKKNDVHIENLTGGTTNRIVLGWHADPRDKILLRFGSISCITVTSYLYQLSINT